MNGDARGCQRGGVVGPGRFVGDDGVHGGGRGDEGEGGAGEFGGFGDGDDSAGRGDRGAFDGGIVQVVGGESVGRGESAAAEGCRALRS